MNREKFEVEGAGFVHVSPNANGMCGNAIGFNFAVSWSHGGRGGVMDRAEAKRLADHIYAALDDSKLLTRGELLKLAFGRPDPAGYRS